MLLLLLACAPTEHPPASWSADGCSSADGRSLWTRTDRARLELDDGVGLSVEIREPSSCGPAVVMIPGGLQVGLSMLDTDQTDALLDAGVAVVAFDPRGRGESEGEEDANGATAQDDLAAVLRWTAARDRVDPGAVVVFSRSFGAAMASGALARHGDLSPVGWLDYEGPGFMSEDIQYAQGQGADAILDLAEASGDPESWWAEREPAGFIDAVTTGYWRIQGRPDHALGARLDHTLACLNAATSAKPLWLNDVPISLPVTEADIEDHVIGGGLEPDAPYVTAVLLSILQ